MMKLDNHPRRKLFSGRGRNLGHGSSKGFMLAAAQAGNIDPAVTNNIDRMVILQALHLFGRQAKARKHAPMFGNEIKAV